MFEHERASNDNVFESGRTTIFGADTDDASALLSQSCLQPNILEKVHAKDQGSVLNFVHRTRPVVSSFQPVVTCLSGSSSRLFPEVLDDCSSVGRGHSPRARAIIRELNETGFCSEHLGDGRCGWF